MFVLPAIIASFVLCFPLLAVLYTKVFKTELTGIFLPIPSFAAVFSALLVGLLIPFISAFLPVFRVLN